MKTIKSLADLAINGAPPAFDEALHVGRPNLGDKSAFLRYAEQIYDSRWLTNNGPLVRQFESEVATLHGVKNCVAMCNGTLALEIAIRALGLHGEVIVPSWTFIATAHALAWQEIVPVFADIDPLTHHLDLDAVRRMITPRTTGIIGVHLWGRPAPVEGLQALADEFGLQLMFDAAHAFGCAHAGRRIGGFGRCEVLSFHATKIFNAIEGGAVLTDDDELAEAMRLMRNFGFQSFDNVIHPGTNGKLSEINAAMGLVNLEALPRFIAANQVRFDNYVRALHGVEGIRLLRYDEADRPNYQYVVVEVEAGAEVRDRIIEALCAENILARRYFWPGCHGMKPYRDLYPHARLLLPQTERVADRVLVLPTGETLPEGTEPLVAQVIRLVLENA